MPAKNVMKWAVVAACMLMPLAVNGADSLPEELDRADRRAELIGWEAVGRLDIAGRQTCSGALIAPDLVLTAAHCVVSDDNTPVDARAIIFRAGLRNGDYIAQSRALSLAIADGYDARRDTAPSNIRQDIALIKLASPVARGLAAPFPVHRSSKPRGELMVASYGQGRNGALSIQRECHVLDYSQDIYSFDCDVTFGSSGAPVFAYDGGRRAIVSVVSAVGYRDGVKIGFGMSLLDEVGKLRRKIANGAGAAPTKPAVVKRITVGGGASSTRMGSAGNSKFLRPGG